MTKREVSGLALGEPPEGDDSNASIHGVMEPKMRRGQLVLELVAWGFVLAGLYAASRYSYLLFHGLAELFSIVVACSIFIVAWNARRLVQNHYLLFLGIAYVFVAFIDLIHTLSYKGMGVFEGYGANLSTQLWILARSMESVALLLGPVFLTKRIRSERVVFVYFFVTLIALLSIFQWDLFPVCFIEGKGLTDFKKISEYVISSILAASFLALWRHRAKLDRTVFLLISFSIGSTIASELAFTFYVSVYGFSNLIGHYLKIISFYLLYKAIVETGLARPYDLLFRELKQSGDALRMARDELEARVMQRTDELRAANEELQRENAERRRAQEDVRRLNEELERRVLERTAELAGANALLHREVLDRKLKEAALRETKEYLEGLINYASAPIIVWVPAFSFTITRFNGAAERLTGYKAEEVIGKPLSMLFPEETQEDSLREIARTSAGEKWDSVEIPILRKDGENRTVLWNSANVYTEDGETLLATMAQGQDITERKRAEERIVELNEALRMRALELEAANKELEAFSYSVSHDLRAPLRAIDGFSRILLEEYAGELAPEAQRYLRLVRENTRQMGELVDDLLSFSRLSRQPLKKETVAPVALVRRCMEELRPEREGRRVEVVLGELPNCLADPILLKQVWVNLLSNALKFTRKREGARIEIGSLTSSEFGVGSSKTGGSELRVSSFEFQPETRNLKPETRIYFVRDNGAGFDMRYADKLFGVFQRLHRPEEYEGTGVGLAIVQRVVSRHGGKVWAQAEPDKGATFYFTL